jgi:hypothetical protein
LFSYQIIKGDLKTSDILSGELTREIGEDVGDYLFLSTLSNSNYNFTYVAAFLRITSKKEIIIIADVKSKIYGAADPELTYTITTGILENGDVLSGSLTRVVEEDAGDYVISSTLSNNNDDITFISNNLSIVQREITITADIKTKKFGDTDPVLTYQITKGSFN